MADSCSGIRGPIPLDVAELRSKLQVASSPGLKRRFLRAAWVRKAEPRAGRTTRATWRHVGGALLDSSLKGLSDIT